jgi:PAS domain S-box-containing protein
MSPIDDNAANARDIAALVARSPFARQLRGGAPLFVVARTPERIVFASKAAHALFRTGDLEQLNAAVLAGASPGARRLRQLANGAIAGAPPKLELLRFFVGRLPVQLGLQCAGVVDAQGRIFLVAAPPASATDAVVASEAAEPSTKQIVFSDPPASAAGRKSVAAPRFLWSANEHLCFDAPATALVDAVGGDAPRPSESLDALKARTGIDESGEFAKALASQATFGSLRLAWPRETREGSDNESGEEAVVVVLSGAPIFDRQRRFLGYRGFGVLTGETTRFEARRPIGEARQAPPSAPPLDPFEATRESLGGGEETVLLGPKISLFEPNPPMLSPVDPTLAKSAAADAAASGAPPLAIEASESEPQTAPERRVEIAPLRGSGQAYPGSPNVVPIRPGALPAFLAPDDGAERREDSGDSVELTTHERDAFREIARALGAKIRDQREGRKEPAADNSDGADSPAKDLTRDPIDLGSADSPGIADPAEANARAPAAADLEEAGDAHDLLDRLPMGVLATRGDEALYVNRTLLDLLGYQDLAQFRASSGLSRIFGGSRPEQLASSGEGGELSLIAANGETIAVNAQIQAIKWGGEGATLICVRRSLESEFAHKLRGLERDARARQADAHELAAVLDTATDGVVMLDSQGRILSLNRPGEALFGFDQKEVVGENFLTLLSPESHETVKAYFEGLRTSGLASLLNDGREALGRERYGRALPLFITLGRIDASAETKFCAVLRDMTHWKSIERDLQEARGQAEKASALKSEFLAKISHEIRTPLNAILGFAEVIMDERFGPMGNDRYKAYVKDIHASGAHVMSLINDLLDLSKIEAGKIDLDFAAVDANSVIQECVSLMQPQAAHERIIMRLSLFDKLPKIVADERSLRQIMLNLMSNAVKFNEPGGQVIVSTAMNDSGQAVIRVRDTGIGMSDAELGTALEPFRRIATARQTGGTGLGLPLTKALVEANRAGFTIKSRKEQGTLVEVAFPTVQVAAAQ